MGLKIYTNYARKRWGHGELLRVMRLVKCRLFGHKWRPWWYDWPYDLPEVYAEVGDPRADQELDWARGCNRSCGAIQMTQCSLLQRAALPGDSGGIIDNPIRETFIHYGGTHLP